MVSATVLLYKEPDTHLVGEICGEALEFADLACVEGANEGFDPLVLRSSKTLENGVLELGKVSYFGCFEGHGEATHQFSKVVDSLSQQSGNTQIVRPSDPVRRLQIPLNIDTRQVQERVLEVRSVFRLDFVVVTRNSVESRSDNRLDCVLFSEQLLAFV